MMQELIKLEADYPELSSPDSPSLRVGSPPVEKFETVEHSLPMLSLDNGFNDSDIMEFNRRIKKNLNIDAEIIYTAGGCRGRPQTNLGRDDRHARTNEGRGSEPLRPGTRDPYGAPMRHRLCSITHSFSLSRLSRRRIVGSLLLAAIVGLTVNALPSGTAPTAEAVDSATDGQPMDLERSISPAAQTTKASLVMPAGTPLPVHVAAQAPALRSDAAPTRVVIEALDIDLAVVTPPAGETFPYCNVAEYLTFYSRPGLPGVTYVYAHARTGMFLPLLQSSQIQSGAGMLGDEVQIYTEDDLVRTYQITAVHRNQRGFGVIDALDGDALVLQTSETAYHTGSKLVIVARPTAGPKLADAGDAHPKAEPKVRQ